MRLEQAQLALETASREHERLSQQRQQIKQSIEAIGQAYHFVDLERGVRRNGHLIASDIRTQIETIRTVA
jgi:multidrug resistance efflux pump